MNICPYCGIEFTIENSNCMPRKFCSVSCRHSNNQYEKQIRILHQRLIDKVWSKPDSIRLRKYRENKVDAIMYEMLT